jgi:hypothetical protein
VGFTAKKIKWLVKSVRANRHRGSLHEFPERSVPADIHGILMRVASLPDTLRQQTPERLAGHHVASRSAPQTPQAAARRSGEED